MAIKITDIHDAIHKGAKEADKDYRDWSRGWSLKDSGVEGLLVSRIAKMIYAYQSEEESILLEVPYKICKEWAGVNPAPGRPVKTFKGTKRVDIALFNGNGRTKYIVEVKRLVTGKKALYDDLNRICKAIEQCSGRNDGTMRRAFLALLVTHKKGKETRMNNIRRWTKDFVRGYGGGVRVRVTEKFWDRPDDRHWSMAIEVRVRSV